MTWAQLERINASFEVVFHGDPSVPSKTPASKAQLEMRMPN